jgi:hypothetical protein
LYCANIQTSGSVNCLFVDQMTYTFSGGLVLSLLFLTVVIALPVKLAAHFAGAKRTGILWCGASVAAGILLGYIASSLFGGFLGGPLAGFLGFVLGIRLMLDTSFVAAVGLSVIAFGLSLAGLSLLSHLGVIISSPSTIVST